ncbi:hypothetical protein Pint_25045 [Pistacia integerrima]|uniref:Uncharacterized protein n=1 Tax=Pistacia integerrima TaxID=434235 RepID=A0ACC0YDF9_9ROSI|nr:hypothetical protein Pint_25045 [Pistacia integerrima]
MGCLLVQYHNYTCTVLTHVEACFSQHVLPPFCIFGRVDFGGGSFSDGMAASFEAYNGLRGSHHVGWSKVCPTYDKFCVHVGTSAAMSLLASFILVFLIMLSFFSLYKRALHEIKST